MKKSLKSIVFNLFGHRLDVHPLDGRGVMKRLNKLEQREESILVPNVNNKSETRINNSTTSPQSWNPTSDSFPGTLLQNVSSADKAAIRSFVPNATIAKLEEKTNEGGIKNDQDKVRLELISPEALLQLGKVLTHGARKYESHNWRKGISYSRILGAILRHVVAYLGGESKDQETGLSHIAHAMCECMFLLEFEKTHPELDDRYVKEKEY